MLNRYFSVIFLCLISSGAFISCAGSKPATGPAPVMSEYDAASGTWVSTTHVAVPGPSQDTPAMVAAKDKHQEGVLTKIGNTLKKPLAWLP